MSGIDAHARIITEAAATVIGDLRADALHDAARFLGCCVDTMLSLAEMATAAHIEIRRLNAENEWLRDELGWRDIELLAAEADR